MSTKPILIGVACAAVAQFLALCLAAGGHGWVAPFFFSPLLFLAYPVILVRRQDQAGRRGRVEVVLLLVAIAADALLITNATGREAVYFNRMMADAPIFLIPWLGLWALWQILAIWLFSRRFREAEDD